LSATRGPSEDDYWLWTPGGRRMTGGRDLFATDKLPDLSQHYGVHGLMVRILPCDGRDAGSIPAGHPN